MALTETPTETLTLTLTLTLSLIGERALLKAAILTMARVTVAMVY